MEIERAREIVAGASAGDLQRAIDGVMEPGERSRINTALATLVLHGRETGAWRHIAEYVEVHGEPEPLLRALAGDTGEGAG